MGRKRQTVNMRLRAYLTPTLVGILLASGFPAVAQMDEYSIKAAYLYNFTKYVEWPEASFSSQNTRFALCVAGEDPFEGKLEQVVSGRTAGNGRPFEVRYFKTPGADSLKGCHLLFLSKSERRRAADIVDVLDGQSVFTVADFWPFAEKKGVADLRIEGTKVKVDLNMAAAQRANLKVSSKLQQVANLVSEAR